MRSSRTTARLLAAAVLGLALVGVVPPASADAAVVPAVDGTACGEGTGVSVVVDFTPDKDSIGAGCAAGEQQTIGDAAQAAGFDLTVEGGLLCAVDGVVAEPQGCSTFPGASWSIYLSTDGGLPQGATADEWQIANVGLDAGPMAAGSAVLFQIQPYIENYPEGLKQPQVSLPDLLAGQVTVTVPTEPTSPPPTSEATPTGPTTAASTAESTDATTASTTVSTTDQPTSEPTTATTAPTTASSEDSPTSPATSASSEGSSAGPTGAEGSGATESQNSSALFWTIVGVAVLVIVAAIAIIVARRRAKGADDEFSGR